MSEVLVLDAAWSPVARVGWERAITLLWENKVEVIENHEDRVVRSTTQEWKVPSVVRWLKMTTHRKKAIKFSRDNVYARDKGTCQYCGAKVSRNDFTYDHVTPRSKGGKTVWENVVVCCGECNAKKGDKTLYEARMRLLSTPVKPKKLSEAYKIRLEWQPTMPASWRNYIRNSLYWKDELEQD